jgi:Protein of unknown function (DUF2783)
VTAQVITTPNLHDPDGFYAAYVAAHQGLSDEASELLNARLVLILANQIGDPGILADALRLAAAPQPRKQAGPAVAGEDPRA